MTSPTQSGAWRLSQEQLELLDERAAALEERLARQVPTWRWVAGIIAGVIFSGGAMAQKVATEAKQDLLHERAERGQTVKEIKDELRQLKEEVKSAQRNADAKLDQVLDRLPKRRRE
jgi:hypothetical protein